MRTVLLSHNKTAYQKVMKAFEESDRTCVVHPTGTGKSYLIAAVSESFRRVLVLGPNTFVLDQVHDVLAWRDKAKDAGTVEYMNYPLLMNLEQMPTGYDLVCLDEFHRVGAPEWGEAVDRLLEANPQSKVFGTTATHIRYLDDERNMADELFGGNVASHITIAEAWNRNILPIPRYVSGLFHWDKALSDATERIGRSRRLAEKEKRERIFRLTNARVHWELSYGMPAILRRHLDRDARRVIVFCGNIDSLENMKHEVVGWFREAGFTIAGTCLMHSGLTDREQRGQMERFEDDGDGRGVKLMFSVNMLNEGIHVPNVNAVLMLRTTSSRIIYLQQMGRCLTAANTEKPLVLDMVDNITTTTAIRDLQDDFDAIEVPQAEIEGREPRRFEVRDYTLGVRDLIEKLAPREFVKKPYEEHLEQFMAFCNDHDRLPSAVGGAEHEEHINYLWLLRVNKKSQDPRFMEIYRKYRPEKESDEQLLQRLLDFVAENDRIPSNNEGSTLYERNLYYLVRQRLKDHPKVKELWEKYSKSLRIPFEERLQRLVDFVSEHHRLPDRSERKEYSNYGLLRGYDKNSENDTLNRIIAKYGKQFKDIHVKIKVLDFVEEHGRLPGASNEASRDEKNLYNLFLRRIDMLYDDPDIAPLMRGRKEKTKREDSIRMVEEFCQAHGRKPDPDEGRIFHLWESLSRFARDPRVIALRKEYATRRLLPEDKILAMQEYTASHGHRPPGTDTKNYRIWNTMLKLGKDDPRVKEMRRKYAKNMSLDDKMEAINDHVARYGRCPTKADGNLYYLWNKMTRENIDDPRVKALYDRYGIRRIPLEERISRLQQFTSEHGRCPKPSENGLHKMWKKLIEWHKDDPRVKEMYDKYGGRVGIITMEEKIAVMQQFITEHGRRPKEKEAKMYSIWCSVIQGAKDDPRVREMREKYVKPRKEHDAP